MDRNDVTWRGYFAATPTPFTASGALDLPALRKIVGHFVEEGAHGIVVNGSSGEWYAQDSGEREEVAAVALEQVAGAVPTIIGVSSIDPDQTHRLIHHAASIGADGVMFSPPPGWRLSVPEVLRYYEQLTAGTDLPVMLYNIPADVATNLAPDTIAALADLPNIVAVKESNRDDRVLFETARLAGDRIRVFGNLMTRPGLGLMAKQWGADGYIGGGMLLGRDLARAFEAVWAGDLDTALSIVDRLEDLQASLNDPEDGNGLFGGIPGQLKAIMNLMGQPAGTPRFPRSEVSVGSQGLDGLRKVLIDHGLQPVR